MCFRVKRRWTTKSGRDGYYTGLLAVMWTLNSFLLPLACGLMLDRSAWCSPSSSLHEHRSSLAGSFRTESARMQALIDDAAAPLRSPPACSALGCLC